MDNSQENLNETITESYRQHQRDIAIKTLASRPTLTMAQVAKLLESKEHGPIISTIQLNDLFQYFLDHQKQGVTNPAVTHVASPVVENSAPTTETPSTTSQTDNNRVDRSTGHTEIKTTIAASGSPIAISEIVAKTGYDETYTRTLLRELIESGSIKPVGAGRGRKYTLA